MGLAICLIIIAVLMVVLPYNINKQGWIGTVCLVTTVSGLFLYLVSVWGFIIILGVKII